MERATRLAGSRFVCLTGEGARLHRALANFMLDLHRERRGYREVNPPFLVNRDCFFGTGQLPKFADDQFRLEGEDDYYLIPTAEVPVTNMYRDTILPAEALLVRPGSGKAIKDAMLRLGDEPGLALRLGAAARARVERAFTWKRSCRQLVDCYRSLAGAALPPSTPSSAASADTSALG